MKKTFILLLMAIGCLFQAPLYAANTATTDTDPPTAKCITSTETLELEQTEFNTTLTLDPNVKFAQRYYPRFASYLSSIKVRFASTTVVGDVTLSVFEDDGGINALGTPLSTVTLTNLSITDDYAMFQLPAPVLLFDYENYFLVLETTGDYELSASDENPYGNGLLYTSPTNVTNYVVIDDVDLTFSAFVRGVDVALDLSGNAQIAPSDIDDGSSDASGIKSLSLSTSTFDCSSVRNNPHIVTLTVTDNHDNQSSCTATIVVRDTVPPIVECFDLTVELDDDGDADFSDSDWRNEPSDDCGIQRRTTRVVVISDCTIGESFASLNVEDFYRNESTCRSEITIKEYDPPVASCKEQTVMLDANGIARVSPSDIDNGSSDACGIKTMSASPNSFDCSNIGQTHTVLLFVVDKSDNNAACTANVTIADNASPMIACPTATLRRNTDPSVCTHTVVGTDLDPMIDDNCSVNFSNDLNHGTSLGGEVLSKGKTTVTWTATDPSGNSATCTYDIRIRDREAPVFDNCPQAASYVVPFCSTGMVHTWPALTATDNCTKANKIAIDVFPLSGSTFPLGTATVTATAEDKAGNVGDCSFTVTVTEDCDQLPLGMTNGDIGNTGGVVGKTCYDSSTGTFEIKTSGSGIPNATNSADGLHLVARDRSDATIEVIAQVVNHPTNNYQDRVGVMIRDNNSSSAASVACLITGDNKTMLVSRPGGFGSTSMTTLGPTLPGPLWPGPSYWVRLQKVGASYTGAVSPDGTTWTTIGTLPAAIFGSYRIGIAATAGTPGQVVHYTVDNLSIPGGIPPRLGNTSMETLVVTSFPNPVRDQLNVQISVPKADQVVLSLSNAVGQKLIIQHFDAHAEGMIVRNVEMRDLATGVYLLEVKTSTASKTIKVRKF